jgi:LysM domain
MSALTAIEAPAMAEQGTDGAARPELGPRGRRLKAVGGVGRAGRANPAESAIDGGQPRSSSIPQVSSGPRAGRRSSSGAGAPNAVPAGRVSSGAVASDPVLAGSIWAGPVPARPVSARPAPARPAPARPAPAARTPRPELSRARAAGVPTRLRLTRRGRIVVAALVIAGVTVAALLITFLASGGAQATNHGQARAGYQGMHKIVVQPGQTLWSIASTAEPSADPRIVVQEIMTANALTGPAVEAGQLLWVPR